MKKIGSMICTLFLSVLFLSQSAFAWGTAVHVYIEDQMNTKWKTMNMNQAYGGLAPDTFNYQFDAASSFLQVQTHMNFFKVWDTAKSTPEKALAFGFLSHNFADYTAHSSGQTFGQKEGYVIAKAEILKGYLMLIPQYQSLNIPDPVTAVIAHILVENGVDLLMKTVDPAIGQKIVTAALPPNPNFPLLLVKAYSKDLAGYAGIPESEAAKFIKLSGREFQKINVLYGQALLQDDALDLISEQMAEFALSFLAANGITLPEGTDLVPLAKMGIGTAMALCGPDFHGEIDATIYFVENQLENNKIVYKQRQ